MASVSPLGVLEGFNFAPELMERGVPLEEARRHLFRSALAPTSLHVHVGCGCGGHRQIISELEAGHLFRSMSPRRFAEEVFRPHLEEIIAYYNITISELTDLGWFDPEGSA